MNAGTVFAAALVTALATGLGAAPFLLTGSLSRRWVGVANAAAAGFMLAASVALVWEGAGRGPGRLVGGVVLGALFIVLTQRLLRGREKLHVGTLQGADALKAITASVPAYARKL